jgi:hypothetical protein
MVFGAKLSSVEMEVNSSKALAKTAWVELLFIKRGWKA